MIGGVVIAALGTREKTRGGDGDVRDNNARACLTLFQSFRFCRSLLFFASLFNMRCCCICNNNAVSLFDTCV